jgi:hypothetical protein
MPSHLGARRARIATRSSQPPEAGRLTRVLWWRRQALQRCVYDRNACGVTCACVSPPPFQTEGRRRQTNSARGVGLACRTRLGPWAEKEHPHVPPQTLPLPCSFRLLPLSPLPPQRGSACAHLAQAAPLPHHLPTHPRSSHLSPILPHLTPSPSLPLPPPSGQLHVTVVPRRLPAPLSAREDMHSRPGASAS